MKLLLDEDVAVQAIEPLRHVLRDHAVDHVDLLGWKSKSDRHLYPDAASRGYDAILTNDRKQLYDPDITDALKKSRLHYIHFTQGDGLLNLGRALGAILASMPLIVAALTGETGQRIVRIVALSPHNRYELIDPQRDPPRYWPR